MRNLKRALSLALAAIMVIGLMVTGAGAAYEDFTDKDEIKHEEAVKTLTTLNVIAGKEDGSYYDPTGTLTRAEMAKLITYVLNGGTEPVLGTKNTPTYSDIKGHWAEAYIEYCTSMGIIAGDGAGKFNPEGTLTGSQAAKMLLVAMNYKADIFGFTGNSWEINVNREANAAKLYNELGGMNPAAPISRDDAAQLVYNAIQSKTMELTWNQNQSTGEITQGYQLVGASLFADRFNGKVYEGVLQASGSMDPFGATGSGKEKLVVEAQVIDKTEQSSPSDVSFKYAEDSTALVGQYVKVLYNTKDKITYGVYPVSDKNTVLLDTTVGGVSNINNPTNTLKVDGTVYDFDSAAKIAYYNSATSAWDATVDLNALGTNAAFTNHDKVRLIDNDGDEKIDVAIVTVEQPEKVTYVGSDSLTLTNKGQVKNKDASIDGDLAVDDTAIYEAAPYNFAGLIALTKAETVEGEVNEVKKNASSKVNSVKVDGTWYNLSQDNGQAPITDTDGNELAYKNTYTLTLVNGYVAKAVKVQGSGAKVAVIAGKTSNTDYDGNQQVKLLLADGTLVEGYAKTVANANAQGDFVTYTMKDGIYVLTPVSGSGAVAKAGYDNYGVDASNGFVRASASNKTVAGVKVNDTAVVFLQMDKDVTDVGGDIQPEFKVISGADLNKWTSSWGASGEVLYNNSGLGYADVVYIVTDANEATPGVKTTAAYITSGVSEGSDSKGNYSAFTIWDGTDSVNVTTRSTMSGIGKGDAITFDWDGDAEIKNVAQLSTVGALTFSNGRQVKIGANAYTLTSDVTVINVSTKDYEGVNGSAIATAAQTAVSGVYNNNCWFKLNSDLDIELLIIDVTSNALKNTGAGLYTSSIPGATNASTNDADSLVITLNAALYTKTGASDPVAVADGSVADYFGITGTGSITSATYSSTDKTITFVLSSIADNAVLADKTHDSKDLCFSDGTPLDVSYTYDASHTLWS